MPRHDDSKSLGSGEVFLLSFPKRCHRTALWLHHHKDAYTSTPRKSQPPPRPPRYKLHDQHNPGRGSPSRCEPLQFSKPCLYLGPHRAAAIGRPPSLPPAIDSRTPKQTPRFRFPGPGRPPAWPFKASRLGPTAHPRESRTAPG